MKFCSECGKPVVHRVPEGDNLPRHICEYCDIIHYQNPKLVVGCLPVWNEQVLLCKRAIEPSYGLWTLPAGFMENQETLEQAAPHINQIYVLYRAKLLDLDFYAGSESLEVQLFNEDEIPWEQLAFKTIKKTLKHFFADRKQGHFSVHNSVVSERNRLGQQTD